MQHISETRAFKERSLIIKGADAATRYGWTGVPNFILENKELSVGAKLVYAMLLKYAREEWVFSQLVFIFFAAAAAAA
jgi:hypothetical protein